MNKPLPRWAVPAFLAAITLIVFARVIFGGETFVLRDHISYVGPSRMYLHAALHAGRFPGWWGQIGLGAPYAANPSHDVFYPPVLLLAYILPGRIAADWIVILHIFWAGLGGAMFARRLGADDVGAALGGAAVMLSGYVISMPPLCNAPLSTAWLPWLAACADRLARGDGVKDRVRSVCYAAICWCALVLVGDPAGLMDGMMLVTVVLLARSRWEGQSKGVGGWLLGRSSAFGFMGVAGVLGVGLAGMVALPSLWLLKTSERGGGGFSAEYSASWPLSPFRLLELIWPRAYGDPTEPLRDWSTIIIGHGIAGQSERWSASAHIGLVVLAFTVFAAIRGTPGARGLLAGAIVLLVLALGRSTPLYKHFYEHIPITKFLRYPDKHMSGFSVLAGGLAGAGFTDAWRDDRARRRLAQAIACAVGVLFIAVLVAIAGRSQWIDILAKKATENYQTMQLGDAFNVSLVSGAIAVVTGFGVAFVLWYRDSLPAGAAMPLAACLALVPCVIHGQALQCTGGRSHFASTPKIVEDAALQEDEDVTPLALARTYRVDGSIAHGWTNEEIVYASHDSLVPDMGGPYGYSNVPGYDPANDKRVENIFSTAETRDELPRLMQALDCAWIIYPADKAAEKKSIVRGTTPDNMESLVRIDDRRPRAFLARRWERGTTDDATEFILGDSWDPGLVYLDGKGDASSAPGDLVPCSLSGPSPDDFVETCDSDTGGYAVLLDGMKDGWTATVDGKPATIERADAVVRAVRIPAGPHAIHYKFATPRLRTGFLVAAGAWLLLALMIFVTRER